MAKRKYETLQDWYNRVYNENMLISGVHTTSNHPGEITYQLTEACNLACTYCYQIAKTPKRMSWEVAKRITDYIFELSETDNPSPINKNTPWLIIDFIGGEPLLETELMSKICHYFVDTAIEKNHRFALNFTISISSNGTLYFTPEFQKFLDDFVGHLSFSISIDGDKDAHDACRIYPDGRGSFDDARRAQLAFNQFTNQRSLETKATIARANLPYIDRIIKYFASEGYEQINANTVYEENWNLDDAKLYYSKLKEIADFNLARDEQIDISLFVDNFFHEKVDKVQTWCGGYTSMLAFDPDGNAYPCIRYMPTSLGTDAPPIIIGDCWKGLYNSEAQKNLFKTLKAINWQTQNPKMCLECPIAEGCSDCAAESYQRAGKLGVRNTSSCIMHKARSLANVYYWNTLYQKEGTNKVFEMHLPKEEALQIIGEEEYNKLVALVDAQKERLNK